jgi:membrane-bound lytic murein transglycosylase B
MENNSMKIWKLGTLLTCCILIFCGNAVSAVPADTMSFPEFLESFYLEAANKGITRSTYDKAFSGVTEPDAGILKKAAFQPEFTTEIWDYLDARVNSRSIDDGLIMAGVYGNLLGEIEKKFGVDAPIVLAIWSMETSYGAALLRTSRLYYVPRSLATLAYADKRRQKFARSQLLATLQIVQAGDVGLEQLTGSWAGAMGHTQFIPTSFLAYGVDMDGDGHRNIWHSVPDALATAANLLHKNKWRRGKSWGYEVVVPAKFARLEGETKTLAQWQELGFKRPGAKSFGDLQQEAELKMIGGDLGPGFLALHNFFVLKRYNNSDFYALAVGLLADSLAGKEGMQQSWPRPAGSLSVAEKFELQELLTAKGFYSGGVDGRIGSNTRKGIRNFQIQQNMEVDGQASQQLLEILRKK